MMETERKPEAERGFCPYCDEEIEEVKETSFSYCGACAVMVFYCPRCRKPVPREKKVCPDCGAEIKG